MRIRPLLWIAALAGGCRDDAKSPGREPAISETRLETGTGETVLRLLDQGSEPRRLLRYDLKDWKGGKAALDMEVSLDMRMGKDAAPRHMDLPPMRMIMTCSPAVETKDGNLRAEFSMALENPDGEMPDMNLKGWTVMTPSGRVTDVGFEFPEDAPPTLKQTMDSMRQTLQQMATPFPEEPVGKGGRWELIAPVEMMGLRLEARAVYRLKEFTERGGRMTVEMGVTGSGTLALPGQEDVQAKVESMRSEGTATVAFDLSSLIPEATMETRMSMRISIGEEGALEQDMAMKMRFSRAE